MGGICVYANADCNVCLRARCCFPFCDTHPEKRVFLAGRKGAGKTSLLFNILYGRKMKNNLKDPVHPTDGYNYQVATFTQHKYFEFIDPGSGETEVMEKVWPTFWEAVQFDVVIYVIDVTEITHAKESYRSKHLYQDRQQLSRIICDSRLQSVQVSQPDSRPRGKELKCNEIIIYLNFKNDEKDELKAFARSYLVDSLRLEQESTQLDDDSRRVIPFENFVSSPEDLRQRLGVSNVQMDQGLLLSKAQHVAVFFS